MTLIEEVEHPLGRHRAMVHGVRKCVVTNHLVEHQSSLVWEPDIDHRYEGLPSMSSSFSSSDSTLSSGPSSPWSSRRPSAESITWADQYPVVPSTAVLITPMTPKEPSRFPTNPFFGSETGFHEANVRGNGDSVSFFDDHAVDELEMDYFKEIPSHGLPIDSTLLYFDSTENEGAPTQMDYSPSNDSRLSMPVSGVSLDRYLSRQILSPSPIEPFFGLEDMTRFSRDPFRDPGTTVHVATVTGNTSDVSVFDDYVNDIPCRGLPIEGSPPYWNRTENDGGFTQMYHPPSSHSGIFMPSSGVGLEQCLSRPIFPPLPIDPLIELENWSSTPAISASPLTVVPSQTLACPMTPKPESPSRSTVTVKSEVLETPKRTSSVVNLVPSSSTIKVESGTSPASALADLTTSPTPKKRSPTDKHRFAFFKGYPCTVNDNPSESSGHSAGMDVNPRGYHMCQKGCPKKFKRAEHLKRHMKSEAHSVEKPYVCRVCHKPFNRNDNLRQHYKNTHLDRSSKIPRNTRLDPEALAELGVVMPRSSRREKKL